jgi:hypothetical protein
LFFTRPKGTQFITPSVFGKATPDKSGRIAIFALPRFVQLCWK